MQGLQSGVAGPEQRNAQGLQSGIEEPWQRKARQARGLQGGIVRDQDALAEEGEDVTGTPRRHRP